jgi:hypothetical protein
MKGYARVINCEQGEHLSENGKCKYCGVKVKPIKFKVTTTKYKDFRYIDMCDYIV